MKKVSFFLFFSALFLATSLSAQKTVRLECNLIDVPANVDSIYLFDLKGLAAIPIQSAGSAGDNKYIFNVPAGEPRIYGVGSKQLSFAKVILGNEPDVVLWANAKYMDKARTIGSELNKELESSLKQLVAYEMRENGIYQEAKDASGDKLKELKSQATSVEKEKEKFLESLKRKNKLIYQVGTLYAHPNPLAAKKTPASIADFYGENFFGYADLNSADYDNIPFVYDLFVAYTEKLFALNCSDEKAGVLAEALLDKLPKGSGRHRMALGGMITGFKDHGPLYLDFAKKYLESYQTDSHGEINSLAYAVRKASVNTIGMIPPDLSGRTPEGGSYALSDMRGSVVLIDFWASWCGPCRRENPNVKKVYEKYHSKGFEILGVSLDRQEAAWKKAIEADGLEWQHISDLKGWQSEHAKLYSVRSIPATFLLDKDGKIIAKNLRGPQLENKLKEVFGE